MIFTLASITIVLCAGGPKIVILIIIVVIVGLKIIISLLVDDHPD